MTPVRSLVPLYASPFTLMREFTEEMDRLFGTAAKGGEAGVWYPALEIVRRNGNVRITATLPDVEKDDVRVFVERQALVLEGERRTETSHSTFHREIPLPDGLNPSEVTARFLDGMLVVEFPFKEVPPRAIPIQTEALPIEGTAP